VPGAKRVQCFGGRSAPIKAVKQANKPAKAKSKGVKTVRKRALRYQSFVEKAAMTYELPEALIWAVMRTESAFIPTVVSHKGAQGLMQLMPGTAKDMGVSDAFDPEQNIMGGARFLRILANRFDGDTVKMIAGYHAGGSAVDRANGIPYEQTGEYLRRVLNAYYAYQKKPPTEE